MGEDMSKPQMVDEKYQQYQQNQQRERMVILAAKFSLMK